MGILATNLQALDWFTLAAYFALLMGVTWWVIKQGKDTAEDYFLAGRNLSWWVIGASIFASNIGSEHVVGLAGSGCKDGVAMAHYELHAWCLLILAWVFVPFYARSMVFTMPEFLEKRFSVGSRYVLSIVSLVTFVITKIAVGIYAGGIVFGALLPELHLDLGSIHLDSFWIGTLMVIILTGLYTILGGMRAVAYNDTIQVVVLIIGSTCLTLYGLSALSNHTGLAAGWSELRKACGSDMFNLWKPLTQDGAPFTWAPVLEIGKNAEGKEVVLQQAWYFNGHFPWLGMLFCAPVIGLWYWCTDQYIVQRALGAPNETIGRRGSIFAGMLKILPVFLFIIPGMVCFALAKNKYPGLADIYNPVTGKATEASQQAFPLMVVHLLPAGLRGIVVAGMISALMGSLAGVFNACSTLFTVDLYNKIKPDAPQHQMVRIGRIATVIMVLISIAWIPIIKNSKSLYEYLQTVQSYLAPPIFVAFFFGVFHKRLNAKGCFWAIVVGSLIGLIRLGIDTPVTFFKNEYTKGSLLWIINNIQFQYFSIFITIVSAIVMVAVSYMTAPPDYDKIAGLAYGTGTKTMGDIEAESAALASSVPATAPTGMALEVATALDTRTEKVRHGRTWGLIDLVGTAIVLGAITAAYLYFRG